MQKSAQLEIQMNLVKKKFENISFVTYRYLYLLHHIHPVLETVPTVPNLLQHNKIVLIDSARNYIKYVIDTVRFSFRSLYICARLKSILRFICSLYRCVC